MYAFKVDKFDETLLQQVLEWFKTEQDIYKQTRCRARAFNNVKKKNEKVGLYQFLPLDTRKENRRGPFAPYLTNTQFISDCLSFFQISSSSHDFVWHDVRISRKYFRYNLKMDRWCCRDQINVFFENFARMQLGIFENITHVRRDMSPRLTCFQTLFSFSYIGIVAIQPRRVIVQSENGLVKYFAYYQYVQIVAPNPKIQGVKQKDISDLHYLKCKNCLTNMYLMNESYAKPDFYDALSVKNNKPVYN